MPKVSVIIPTYNRENYICNAIDSVLNQTYRDFEIIISDDGSTDNTKKVLKKYNNSIKYYYQDNGGEASARNFGIKLASGEYIAFLDSDDIWLEQKLEKQMDYIEKTNADLVYCSMFIMEKGIIDYKKKKPANPAISFLDLLLGGKSITTPTILAKKQCMQNIGLFDETFKLACDYEMWLRFSLVYKIAFINQAFAIYRRHSDNLSINSNRLKFTQTGIRIFKKLLMNPNVNKNLVRKKLSLEYYSLSMGLYEEKRYKEATVELKNSFLVNPLIGLSLVTRGGTIIEKFLKIMKPYVVFLYLILLVLKGNK